MQPRWLRPGERCARVEQEQQGAAPAQPAQGNLFFRPCSGMSLR